MPTDPEPTMPAACPEPDLLRQLARGRVSAVAERELDRHLAACPPCSAAHDAWLLPVARAVRRVAAAGDLPPAGRLIDRVRALRSADLSASVSTDEVVADAASRTAVAPDRSTLELPAVCGPERIGKFVIRDRLGSGGMGDVFRAVDDTLHREVALKLLQVPSGVMPTPGERGRLKEEARAAARVEHPHIVRVYEVGEADEVPYIAMELLRGETVADRLRREKALPAAEVCRLGAQMAEGLAAAHDAGLVHRDIKPSNLWLEPGRHGANVRILDFGLARATTVQDVMGAPEALANCRAGTPAYMSPEQAEGRELDARSDLFSLGAVLYEMAAGRRLISGAGVTDVLNAVRGYTVAPATKLLPGVPPPLAALVAGMLANDRDRRNPQTAREAAERLSRLAVRYARRRRPVAWAVTAALLVVGVVGLGQYVMRVQRDEKDPGADLTVPSGTKNGKATVPPPPPDPYQWSPPVPLKPASPIPTLDHLNREAIPPENRAVGTRIDDPTSPGAEAVAVLGPRDRTGGDYIGHKGGVQALALHPNGLLLASGSQDQTVRLWDLSAPEPKYLATLAGHRGEIRGLAFTPDGRLVSGCANGQVIVWDTPARKARQEYAVDAHVERLAVGWTGTRVAVGHKDRATVLDLGPGGKRLTIPGARQEVRGFAFSTDDRKLLVGSQGVLLATDLDAEKELLCLPETKVGFTALAPHPLGTLVACNGVGIPIEQRRAALINRFFPGFGDNDDLPTQRALTIRDWNGLLVSLKRLDHDARVVRSGFSADGTRLITLTENDQVHLWDWVAGARRASRRVVISAQIDRCLEMVVHPDGRHAIVGHVNGSIYIVRLAGNP